MDNFIEIEKKIEEILSRSPNKSEVAHSKATQKWLLELEPNADMALQISALAHDIERAYNSDREAMKKEDFRYYKRIKVVHSKKSADIICNILESHHVDTMVVERVRHLVENHEFGGDRDSDILKESDSLSFFEENLEGYFEKYGEKITRDKIKFMYDRIPDRSKKIIMKFKYRNSRLNHLFREIVL